MSRVNVVIPCYNYARYLPQCVASVLGQQNIDVRALIIDDCSSDDTPRIGAALAVADARVEFRRHAVNRGHIDTYNEGLLEWADGDYVLLFSADDVLTPGALARAVDAMEAHPEVGMAYGAEVTFEDTLPALPPTDLGRAPYDISAGRDLIETCCIAADNPVGPTAVLRTSLQRIVGGYRKDMPHTADLAMWLCCAAHGAVARINAVQCFKRAHPANMIKQYATTVLPDLLQRRLAFDVSLTDHAPRIVGAAELLGRAHVALSGHAFWGAHRMFERGDLDLTGALLDLAVELDPAWPSRSAWRRFGWKRRLGPRVWQMLAPLAKRVRQTVAHAD
jgi:hypothetical protein